MSNHPHSLVINSPSGRLYISSVNCLRIFFLSLIIILFFLLRLPNLTLLPVFADEAIYLRWAQVMKSEPTLRFLPLSDGKQPLFMWLVMIFLKFFKNPLYCGRAISVFSGLGSLAGIFFLGRLVFDDQRVGLAGAFFYAITPFFVFFDRMALVDSLLTCLVIWFFVFSIWLAKNPRLDLAMISGIILGLALITKSPGLFLAFLLPATLLWFRPERKKNRKKKLSLFRLGIFWLVIWFFGFVIYNLLRLGPNFGLISSRNQDYVFSLAEVLSHPLDPLRPHLNDLRQWLPNLFTWPILGLAIWGVIRGFKSPSIKAVIFLLTIAGLPVLAQAGIARVFTPRYLLFAVWPVSLLAAFGLVSLSGRRPKYQAWLILVFLIWPLFYNWHLLTDPPKAPLPRKMRSGYLEEWTSGSGILEAADFIKERLRSGRAEKVLVGTEGYFGTLPDGLQIYLNHFPGVVVLGVGQPIRQVPPELLSATVDNEVYLVVNQSRMFVPQDPRLELIKKYPKAIGPDNQDFLLLYQVKNTKPGA
ncbi:MAG: glycosyltransferase family 39 protein [Candidatus Pacebacteria bacterium]|nr:glycosyltransferase family 39 protein [Candidatus Paceibacterota bacterium]